MGTFHRSEVCYCPARTVRSSDRSHSKNEFAASVGVPPAGVGVAVGVSVNVPIAVGVSVAVAVSVARGVPVTVAVAVVVSVASCVPVVVGVALVVAIGLLVANGVADSEGIFQPFGTFGWTTIPTAVSLPLPRLAGAMIVTKGPTTIEFACPGGSIFNVAESRYSC